MRDDLETSHWLPRISLRSIRATITPLANANYRGP
jgi:hypothetical protein